MMKRLTYILLLCLLAACAKEDALTSMEVKNWYSIEPTDNMDEVDALIYEIYKRYNLAVFYKDTIGAEDRGWKDEEGNPKLYYEVLRLGYDMTVIDNVANRITWNPVDVSIPENKARMLPLLKLLNEELLEALDGVSVFIPAVFIVEDMVKKAAPCYVHRAFSLLAFALDGYQQADADSLYRRKFLHEVSCRALQDSLESFYSVVTYAMEGTSIPVLYQENPWGKNYKEIASGYASNLAQLNSMQTYIDKIAAFSARLEVAQAALEQDDLTEAERKTLETEVTLCTNTITVYNNMLDNLDGVLDYLNEWAPQNFGILKLNYISSNYYVPSKEEEVMHYMDAILDEDEEEFMEKYKNYPYVQGRYKLLLHVLKQAGFNIEKLRGIF